MKFEDGLGNLEGIVTRLEEEELPLEESLGLFEKGIGLVRDLTKQLDEVEKRLETLVKNAEGDLVVEPLEEPGRDD